MSEKIVKKLYSKKKVQSISEHLLNIDRASS